MNEKVFHGVENIFILICDRKERISISHTQQMNIFVLQDIGWIDVPVY